MTYDQYSFAFKYVSSSMGFLLCNSLHVKGKRVIHQQLCKKKITDDLVYYKERITKAHRPFQVGGAIATVVGSVAADARCLCSEAQYGLPR